MLDILEFFIGIFCLCMDGFFEGVEVCVEGFFEGINICKDGFKEIVDIFIDSFHINKKNE